MDNLLSQRVGCFFVFLLALGACHDLDHPNKPIFRLVVPKHIADQVPYPAHNPTSKEGIELGRMLFYDPVLSSNNKISCASCHIQNQAFSDGIALSQKGVSGKQLVRHAPSLVNLAWNHGLFWDGGAKNLESLTFGPLTHPDEMHQNLGELATELENRFDYATRFQQVFHSNEIHSSLVARALAQFQRSLISANSRYDKYIRHQESFSELEHQGLMIFQSKCATCHEGNFFTDFGFHNNGLDHTFPTDHENPLQGRYRVTLNPEDLGKYKTPTLRNISKTAPYMHDGRFRTLEDVLDHYASGMKNSNTLDHLLKQANGKPKKLISEGEKRAILAFLETLTDDDFLQNPNHAKPQILK